jgi:phosphoribosylglycinamide formyltransferase-1
VQQEFSSAASCMSYQKNIFAGYNSHKIILPVADSFLHVAVFASGAGSNAQKLIDHFRHHPLIRVSLIVCNNPSAGVLQIAEREKINTIRIEQEPFFHGHHYLHDLDQQNISFIILAGFLWKIPSALIRAFPQRIINVHPALLPKYGGRGMYGMHVHKAVIEAGETESGISVHYVDEIYDHGKCFFQAKCLVHQSDTPATLAAKIHVLEHRHFPAVAELAINLQNIVKT